LKGVCCIAAPFVLLLIILAAFFFGAEPLREQLKPNVMKNIDTALYISGALSAIAVFICTPVGIYLIVTKPMPRR
jgi:hypothetical protein